MKPLIEVQHLSYARRGRPVLVDINLTITPGEVVALLGANGAGKTTLLRMLMGFEQGSSGEVLFAGKSVAAWSRRELAQRLAYVPQVHVVPFPYTVQDVVTMGRLPQRGWWRAPSSTDEAAVDEALRAMSLTALAGRAYSEISGGERQRCLIARALAQGADMLVLDEPTTGLDFGHQTRLLAMLGALAALGKTVLWTTHHPEQAVQISHRVAWLHEGRLLAAGTPAEVVTAETIAAVYAIAVDIHTVPGGRVFVPTGSVP